MSACIPATFPTAFACGAAAAFAAAAPGGLRQLDGGAGRQLQAADRGHRPLGRLGGDGRLGGGGRLL